MKKPILMFNLLALIAWCWVTPTRAQETTDQIVRSDLTYDDDVEAYYFIVSLEGSRIYTAYNMDINLPEGINVCYDEEEDEKSYWVLSTEDEDFYPFTKKAGKKTFKHQVASSMPTARQLRVSCISTELAEFTATSGTLFYVYVTLDPTKFTYCPKPLVKVSGIALAQADATQQTPADFSCRPFSTGIPTERELLINISASNQVGTLILPFNAALPEGVKAYSCQSVDTEAQSLNLTTASSFEACKPYIVYAENGYSGNISGTVDLSVTYPDEDIYAEGYLTGVLSPTVVNTGYIMQNQGDGPMFYDAEGENFSLPAGRCYFTPSPSAALANVMGFRFTETETTHISGVENGKATSNIFYYDLTGRRVAHPAKGLYIHQGKKVFQP